MSAIMSAAMTANANADDGLLLVRPDAQQTRAASEVPLLRRQLDAQAALYAVEDGFFFRYIDPRTGLEVTKGVSEQAVRAALSTVPVDSGWLPPHTVRWGTSPAGDYAVRFQPAQRVALALENAPLFRARPDWSARARTVTLLVPLPSLLFIGVGAAYYAYAARSNAFAPDLALFAPPLPNLDGELRVCFGANRLPPVEQGGFGEAWDAFLAAPFGADLVQQRSRAHPRDVRLALLAACGRRRYPLEDLVAVRDATPETVLARLLRRTPAWG